MTNEKRLWGKWAAGFWLLGFALCGPAAFADRTAGETIDDHTLASSVKTKLIDDDAVPAGSINIETYRGVVQLIGFVRNEGEKSAAIARAESVDGVDKVVDAMIVVPEKRSFGTTIDDQTIQTKVKYELTEVGADKALAVVTDVRNGEVLLGGFVSSESVRDAIETKAKGVSGVTKVHSFIGIKE